MSGGSPRATKPAGSQPAFAAAAEDWRGRCTGSDHISLRRPNRMGNPGSSSPAQICHNLGCLPQSAELQANTRTVAGEWGRDRPMRFEAEQSTLIERFQIPAWDRSWSSTSMTTFAAIRPGLVTTGRPIVRNPLFYHFALVVAAGIGKASGSPATTCNGRHGGAVSTQLGARDRRRLKIPGPSEVQPK